jgi:hypothetical protein
MRAPLLILVGVSLAALAHPARAQDDACPLSACTLAAFPALAPTVLAGGEDGRAVLAGATGLAPRELPLASLGGTLSAEQEALLGCGPYWGTECARDGIDLRNADVGVLQQSWTGAQGSYRPEYGALFQSGRLVQLPGTRGFLLPGGVPVPTPPQFADELSALSFNMQLLLVAFSSGTTGAPGDPGAFDPSNPYAQYDPNDPATAGARGQCSFLQPQYCSSIQSFYDIVGQPPQSPVAGGNRSFGRRDFSWRDGRGASTKRLRGCLASMRSLASRSADTARGSTGNDRRRAGRCARR